MELINAKLVEKIKKIDKPLEKKQTQLKSEMQMGTLLLTLQN